ncbi:DUF551 domain-containing protein [Enterobacter cloacae]|uniref:DUF551 domain-containing protein n=1 Tax=Enterobacter cloacae TaxID=550 RepID=UPI0028F81EEE|nr:DUF551 domain-containing protein [Enterobacter cloacae]MDT9874097.1 DUF551 domain-containing protein [Enterobacter cloacae]
MSTITRERLQWLSNISGRDDIDEIDGEEIRELARIALASLEAEPVGYMNRFTGRVFTLEDQPGADTDSQVYVPVYTAPPAPSNAEPVAWLWSHRKHPREVTLVRPEDDEKAEAAHWSGLSCQALYAEPPVQISVPDEATPENIEILASTYAPRGVTYQWDRDECNAAADSWNAFRAAMLQGADRKPELTVWYGSMPETNGKTNWTATLHRKGQHPWEGITIDRSEYPDRVLYEADRMRHLIGELADEPDILAYDAEEHSGYVYPDNSPGIPDGWVACSERIPEVGSTIMVFMDKPQHSSTDYAIATFDKYGFSRAKVTHWMPLPAAPQQEVK